jgi:hypothetical protein
MILPSLLTGWALWSFSFYWMHRCWHFGITHDYKAAVVVGEHQHHITGAADPYDIVSDPEGSFVSFPRFAAVVGTLIVAWIWCAIFGAIPALTLLTSMGLSSLFDSFIHNCAHLPEKSRMGPCDGGGASTASTMRHGTAIMPSVPASSGT